MVSLDGDYTVTSARLSDDGAYKCEAVNIVGNMTQTRVVQISSEEIKHSQIIEEQFI